MAARSNIYQFKITLKGAKPKIWRRIQVPETYNFYALHVAIQDAMGWRDCHLHQFEMKHPQTDEKVSIGEPSSEWGFEAVIPEKNVKITKYFVNPYDKAVYEYDFGDGWEHEVVLERIMLSEANVEYPRCVAGKRACPPEDCGGVYGYEQLLKILADPDHEEYKERKEWLDQIDREDFDPDEFDPDEIFFQDPIDRANLIRVNAERFARQFGLS